MDFNAIRIGAIVALFLGSIYVLLPTILQEDPSAALERQAASVQTTEAGSTDLDVRYDVVQGDAQQLAEAIEARAQVQKTKVDAVRADGRQVVVTLAVGGSADEVDALLQPVDAVTLVPLRDNLADGDALPVDLEALSQVPALLTLAQAGDKVLQSAPPVAFSPTSVAEEGVLALSEAPAEEVGPLGVLVGGAFRGVAVVEGTDGAWTPRARYAMLGSWDRLKRTLATPALPGELARAAEAEPPDGDTASDDGDDALAAGDEGSHLPAWLVGLLPDTLMRLGIDLQGGIDLTLQVELDEALLSQANRDMTYLTERAEEQGLSIVKTRRERNEPIIRVASESGLSELTSFFAKTFGGQYEYVDTRADGELTWHLFAMTGDRQSEVTQSAMQQVLDVLRKRVAATGVRDPIVVRKGGGKISVQLPGLTDVKKAADVLGTTAVLEFRMVDGEFSPAEAQRLVLQAEDELPEDQFADDRLINEWLWENGKLSEDRILQFYYDEELDESTGETTETRITTQPEVLQRAVMLTGSDVNDADVRFDPQTQDPYVMLEFKPAGARVFCDVTTENVRERFGIILDGHLQSAPVINEKICGGSARISMGSAIDAIGDARKLAVVLRTGSLNAPVSVGDSRQIGPSLGADAIRAGSIATVIGGVLVLLFMTLWYRTPGLFANVALVLNLMLMLSGLALFGWTLTLPGIAGIALTVGMAVDANIIIYERIREELRNGAKAREAVQIGFQKAAVAVVDANVTTAIAGIVLFSYGNVTIQGFAVTLLIGIGTTLITALYVTRSLLEMYTRNSTARLRL